jgi:hypothetical protein
VVITGLPSYLAFMQGISSDDSYFMSMFTTELAVLEHYYAAAYDCSVLDKLTIDELTRLHTACCCPFAEFADSAAIASQVAGLLTQKTLEHVRYHALKKSKK